METVDKIGFKRYCVDTKLLEDDGYVCYYDYYKIVDGGNLYCSEVNIINKIGLNQDNYFDFSKSMIDIGSEIGVYSFILPFQHSYLFDGNAEKMVIAQFNMLLHHKLEQGTYNVCLLSDKIENIQYDGFCSKYTIKDNIQYDYNSPDIKTTTLDSFNLDNIGFIKVDVECMEYQVLRGGLGTIIRNNYPPILFELWPIGYYGMTQEIHDRLFTFLINLGYDIMWQWGDFETHLAIHK